jgi:DNA-binding MarR family transcriptional regulator
MSIHSNAVQAGPADDLAVAWSRVVTYTSAVDARLGKWLSDTYGLGLTEYHALVHLSAAPKRELRINDLAHAVGLNQSSVTRLLGRLEAKELTFRDTCPDDGRGVYAVITDKGKLLVKEARGPYSANVATFLTAVAAQDPGVSAQQLGRALTLVSSFIEH